MQDPTDRESLTSARLTCAHADLATIEQRTSTVLVPVRRDHGEVQLGRDCDNIDGWFDNARPIEQLDGPLLAKALADGHQ